MNGRLSHIEIYVSNLAKSIEFWSWFLTEKFNYEIYQKWEEGISYKLEETYIVFVQTEIEFLPTKFNRKNTGLNHLAFYCQERIFIDKLKEDLDQKRYKVLYNDKHPFAGGTNTYAIYFEDPDRIKVEVVVKGKG